MMSGWGPIYTKRDLGKEDSFDKESHVYEKKPRKKSYVYEKRPRKRGLFPADQVQLMMSGWCPIYMKRNLGKEYHVYGK